MTTLPATRLRADLYAVLKSVGAGEEARITIRGSEDVSIIKSSELEELREYKARKEFDEMFAIYGDAYKDLADK